MTKRVGFIGLGNIGLPMARNLCGGAFEVAVYDLRPEASAELAALGAMAAGSCREVAERSEVVGVCVRDDSDTERAMLGDEGILAGARPDTIVALHSTIRPRTVRALAEAAAERGVHVLDAPITGGRPGAENRTLCAMVGGDPALLERCRGVLEASASRVVHAGALGCGAVAKLCNNLMTYQVFQAGYEAALLAREAGISPETLEAVTRANGLLNDSTGLFLKLRAVADERRDDAGLQQTLRSFTALAEKDLGLALELAREVGVSLPGAGLCEQQLARVYGVDDARRR
jgi:3-hydroxyisobutyrate dehydrogenase-like beta-hydroxyacid dehydrogenase